MDNGKVEIRTIKDARGRGVFVTKFIKKGEIILDWELGGIVYEAERATDLPKEARDWAIQFETHKWIDTKGLGRWINHSCEPNSGIKGLFKLMAMRDLVVGEEVLWDYDMSENSDWVMEGCRCGSKTCRKLIHGYRFLPDLKKKEYELYISDWLKQK